MRGKGKTTLEAELFVNGFDVVARYDEEAVRDKFLPALFEWSRMAQAAAGRLIVYLCAPPGAGKSTLAAFLERLSVQTPGVVPLQALGMDGFHYPRSEMEKRTVTRDGRVFPMLQVKGGPESFDADALQGAIRRLRAGGSVRWPVYDRILHDVSAESIEVSARIALVEGNWLLFGKEPWTRLHGLCDMSLSLRVPADLLHQRLVDRKIRGGLSPEEAEEFYARSDGVNVLLWQKYTVKAQKEWELL